MKNFLKKLQSRKLWMAIAGVATGVAIALGGDATQIQSITGAITSLVSIVAYIAAEGYIDAASVGNAANSIEDIIEVLELFDEQPQMPEDE